MPNIESIKDNIFNIRNNDEFNALALKVFYYQHQNNAIYRQYCDCLNIHPQAIQSYQHIPFLPVDFFRTHPVVCGTQTPEISFSSSGTTGSLTSFHHVVETKLYLQSFLSCFELFYGSPSSFCIVALLPSYLERSGSSLVFMAEKLIALSQHPKSGFYLHDLQSLSQTLKHLKKNKQKTLLLGVTYALLDLAANFPMQFDELIVMETGGMKGRRKEMIREEVHTLLKNGFGVENIHSEYGMTELLSQAYSNADGKFFTPPWMRILIRDTNDPFAMLPLGRSGGINIIDLANIHSCSFVEVQDLGVAYHDNSFEVLGRFDNSQVRGCNLLIH